MPEVIEAESPFVRVAGTFFRAVDPRYRDSALTGSRSPGRYSSADQPTLYLSSSAEGVEAAMIAHRSARTPDLEVLELRVRAERIVDLRDSRARAMAGIELDDATAPWQDLVTRGEQSPSWTVRRRIEQLGAEGLIDPSRKAPGLWHLVLFRWNAAGGASVRVLR
ncbi:RES family NAD+ phosphorylase [Nesterenkonia muleiensis]|uniref:RES family NAD+ phosphorylase n=1 Tax=Nesterenkonia muleiensis TaxID=2282648 RepID=UPI000E71810C|nr:RES domain-containing protein [Nesterenkonia muleiensis]